MSSSNVIFDKNSAKTEWHAEARKRFAADMEAIEKMMGSKQAELSREDAEKRCLRFQQNIDKIQRF